MTYLAEIRRRLLVCLGVYGVLFCLFFCIQERLLNWLLMPLLLVLPKQNFMLATQVASPVLAPFYVASDAALLISFPIFLFQFWQFLKPALHRQERYMFKAISLVGLFLFISGFFFCFYAILPFLFQLFSSMTPTHVRYFPELSAVIQFSLNMLILFGVAFQLPLLVFVMVRFNWVSYQTVQQLRPYVIVLAFVLGMLLTPPDVLSQIVVAIPLWLLYETGVFFIWIARFY